MEWDTAAGHCILNFSGGQVIDMYTGEPIHYNKEDLHQPEFLALAKS
jgi:3'(2'), 5'-bisphosphate nucleotidase